MPEARTTYDVWYRSLEDSVHAARLDTYAMRLMPLLAINEGKDRVNTEIVEKIIKLCNWQLEARCLFDPIDADNTIATLEEGIRRNLGRGPKTTRQLYQNMNANRHGVHWFNAALSNLHTKSGEITWIQKDKKWHLVVKV